MKLRSIISTSALVGFSLLASVSAHASIQNPTPIKYADYQGPNNYNPPLSHTMSDFPCKGLHMTPGGSVQSWTAGGQGSFTINDQHIAAHSGGSCQASMSFDSGKTWKVLKSFQGGCPRNANANAVSGPQTFDFPIPKDAPNGNALFSWTWFPVTGLRDMYQNCAVVTIKGGSPTTTTSYSNSENLPDMFVGAINGCINDQDTNLIFPFPGPNVVNDTTTQYQFAAPKGNCDATGKQGTGGGGPLNSACLGPGPNLNADSASPSAPAYGAAPSAPAAGSAKGGSSGSSPAFGGSIGSAPVGSPAAPAYGPPSSSATAAAAGTAGAPHPPVYNPVPSSPVAPLPQPGTSSAAAVGVSGAVSTATVTATVTAAETIYVTVPAPVASSTTMATSCKSTLNTVYGGSTPIQGTSTIPASEVPTGALTGGDGSAPNYGSGSDTASSSAAAVATSTTAAADIIPITGTSSASGSYSTGTASGGAASGNISKPIMVGGCPVSGTISQRWSQPEWKDFCTCLNTKMDPDAISNFAATKHFCDVNFGKKAHGAVNTTPPAGAYRKRMAWRHVHRVHIRNHYHH